MVNSKGLLFLKFSKFPGFIFLFQNSGFFRRLDIGTVICKSHSPPFWRKKKPTPLLLTRTKNFRCFWKLSEFIPLTNDYLCIVIHVHMISESPVAFCFVFMEKYRYLWCPNSHIFRRWAWMTNNPLLVSFLQNFTRQDLYICWIKLHGIWIYIVI